VSVIKDVYENTKFYLSGMSLRNWIFIRFMINMRKPTFVFGGRNVNDCNYLFNW